MERVAPDPGLPLPESPGSRGAHNAGELTLPSEIRGFLLFRWRDQSVYRKIPFFSLVLDYAPRMQRRYGDGVKTVWTALRYVRR